MSKYRSHLRRLFKAEYNALKNAIHRCHSENSIAWDSYGGRGIEVAEAWRGEDGFARFLDHIGPRPTPDHSLDRINNSTGNYEEKNVRWADRKTQQNNRRPHTRRVKDLGWGVGYTKAKGGRGRGARPSALVPFEGRIQTLREWADELQMCAATIRQRLQRGLTVEQAFDPCTSRKGEKRKPTSPTIH